MGLSDLLLRLRALTRHGQAENELDEELRFHLEMEARKNRTSGIPDTEARRSARVAFGGVEQVREECRDIRGITLLENLVRDVRYGSRVLRKTPVFTGVAILSLAIGIGANTAVFSVLDRVLLRLLPVRNAEELVVARWGAKADVDLNFAWRSGGGDANGNWTANVFSWTAFTAMRAQSRILHDLMAFAPLGPVNVAVRKQALSGGAMLVSGNYYAALGVQPVVGRALADDNEMVSGLTAAMISYRFWDRAFARDPAAIGATIHVNGQPCIVVGVTPKAFIGVSPGGFIRTPEVDVTLPMLSKERIDGTEQKRIAWFANDWFWIQVMGRMAPGADRTVARNELKTLLADNLPPAVRETVIKGNGLGLFLDSGSQGLDSLRSTYQKPLRILMAVVGVTLLMACANLAGLLLARAAARRREIQMRLAVGASRARLIWQLLVEGALLSVSGTAVGLFLAYQGVKALQTLLASGDAPLTFPVEPDARILAFTAATSLLTTLLFALAPALRATRVDVASGLKEDAAGTPGGRFGATRALVAVQVAVAMVLLAGATLFTRTLVNLRSIPLGFQAENLVLFDLAPGKNGYDETRGTQLYTQVLERLRQTPGLTGATLSTQRLISGWVSNGSVLVEGTGKRANSTFNFVGPDFLDVMRIRLVLGRGISARDMAATPRVAVINETLARRRFADGSPIGKRFRWSSRKEWDVEIVGVVSDARYDRLRGEAPATIYVPYTQRPFGWPGEASFEVRTAGDAAGAVTAIRRAIASIDPMLPLMDVKTQEAQIADSLSRERMFATLVGLFSIITLVLAAVGLYGLVAYSVTSRTREIGVRMALGASRPAVLGMLLRQVGLTIGAGLAVGLPATWALTRIIESQLYGVKAHDPLSLASAVAGVTVVALGAALLPARKAVRIDPVSALRYE